LACPGSGSATSAGRLRRLEVTSAAYPAVSWSEVIAIRWLSVCREIAALRRGEADWQVLYAADAG
jgi:hypothetical protein